MDSGIGGLSVLSYAMKMFPKAHYIYYADTDNVPYGTKTKEEIIKYTDCAADFLVKKGVSAIVVACNTATSMAIAYLREKYRGVYIVGMEPAVKLAAHDHAGERILICATPLTIGGEKLHSLIEHNFEKDCLMPDLVALPKLVTYAENGIFDKSTVCGYFSEVFGDKRNYSSIVLGCTHFIYFKDSFIDFFGKCDIIDGTVGTVNRLFDLLKIKAEEKKDTEESVEFYRSGRLIEDPKTIAFNRKMIKRSREMAEL